MPSNLPSLKVLHSMSKWA